MRGERRFGRGAGLLLCLLAVIAVAVAGRSPAPTRSPEVIVLGFRGDAFYVNVWDSDSRVLRPARSEDGGRTWVIVDRSTVPKLIPTGLPKNMRCADDGICYRRNQEGLVVERGSMDLGWTVEYTTSTPRALSSLDVNPNDSSQAIVQVDVTVVAYRDPGGIWTRLDVAAAIDPPEEESEVLRVLMLPVTSAVLALLLAVTGAWRARPGWRQTGWVLGNVVMLGLVMLLPANSLRAHWLVAWILGAWIVVAAVLLLGRAARRRTREAVGHP